MNADQQFEIRSTDGESLMARGQKHNVRAYFEQNDCEFELRRFDERGVTVIVVSDVREEHRP